MKQCLLIMAVLITTALGSCISQGSVSDLEIGSMNFAVSQQLTLSQEQRYTETFTRAFSRTPSIALALQNFNIIIQSFMQWKIAPEIITTTAMLLKFERQGKEWIFAKVGYFASARSDFFVGNYQSDFPTLQGTSIVLTINLGTMIPNYQSSSARVFLTGFRKLSGSSFDIQTLQVTVKQTSLEYQIKVGSDISIVSAQINYVLFNSFYTDLVIYSGDISDSDASIHNILRNAHESRYTMFGLTGLQFMSQKSIGFVSTVIDPFSILTASQNVKNAYTVSYLVVGIKSLAQCALCPSKTILDGQCVATCPDYRFRVNYPDGGAGCHECPAAQHMQVNFQRNGCQCMSGYSPISGICMAQGQSPTNSFMSYVSAHYSSYIAKQTANWFTQTGAGMADVMYNCSEGISPQGMSNYTQEKCIGCRSTQECRKCRDAYQNQYRIMYMNCREQKYCGNGIKYGSEQCDDGNMRNGDGCSTSCVIESNYRCQGSPSVCQMQPQNYCGNGIVYGTEQCDDGNMRNEDGCNQMCQIQNGYSCTESPSRCSRLSNRLSLFSPVMLNSNQVFVRIQTDSEFSIPSQTEFLQYRFPITTTRPTMATCNQDIIDKRIWNCLNIYSYGIPTQKFNIIYNYNYQGQSGQLTVEVDPNKNSNS